MEVGIIRISFTEGAPLDLPGSKETIHVFHGVTKPWKPIPVKFIAPKPGIMQQLIGGHAQFLLTCRRLASDAVTQQVNHQKLGLKCFACGGATTGFAFWNFLYAETADILKWINYGACTCDSVECAKVLEERVRGWFNTGKNKIHEIN
jgi:hypothetical protein